MSAHLQRALLLLQQHRSDLAEQELRQALTQEPHNARAHALLALCLLPREQFDAAQHEAEQAVALEPDSGFPHYVLSKVLESRNRFAEAKSAIQEAIRLEPYDSDYFAQLSAVEFSLRDWPAALAAAEQGLQIDPEDVACTNLRVQALTKLGRRTDADAAVEAALRRAPDDAATHANRGWTLLEQGNSAKAMEHFREALRLNPEMDWARAGIVEALKARNFIYRILLNFIFWMSRLSRRAQWGVILGGWLLYQFTRGFAASHPEFEIVLRPLIVLYVCFVLLTWLGRPIFNTLLRFNRFGRLALSKDQRIQSNLVCATLLPAAACGIYYAFTGNVMAQFAGFILGFTAMLSSVTLDCGRGWPRTAMAGYTLAFFALGAIIMLIWQAEEHGTISPDGFLSALAPKLIQLLVAMLIGMPIAANVLANMRARR